MGGKVAIVMGSQSDWPTMRCAAEVLEELEVTHEARIVSAHRTPDRMSAFAKGAEGEGFDVIIAGAGGAAHLPGMIAAAVDRELADKGFELASVGRANFLVAMSASVQDVTVISKHRYQGWSHGYNRSALTNVNTATQMDKMTEGTLVLEVIDTDSEGVVWQSRAAGVVTRRDGIEQAVDRAVRRMLDAFPPDS